MPKVALLNVEGAQVGEIELNDAVFGIEPNESVVHEAVVMQMASWRQGTHCTKSRGEVREAAANHGDRKGLVVPELVLFVLRCGVVVLSFSGQNQENIAIPFQRKKDVLH